MITISAKPAGVDVGIELELNGRMLLSFALPTDQAEAFAGDVLKACEAVREAQSVREMVGPPSAEVVGLMEALRESLKVRR